MVRAVTLSSTAHTDRISMVLGLLKLHVIMTYSLDCGLSYFEGAWERRV